ncbi:MAG TPA: pyruvate kinase [Flavobacterium sp.]|nr:pyruvate kinase [Flavobacterium sp.]
MKIEKLCKELDEILQSIIENESKIDSTISEIHEDYRLSAKNLCRYLILRSYDLRKFQASLSDFGVSSLGASEGYVYSNLYNVVRNLKLIQGLPIEKHSEIEIIGYKRSSDLIKENANTLFNMGSRKNTIEIMVTLPNEASEDKTIIEEMVANGMEIARINLSHGNIHIWTKMVQFINEIKAETNQKMKIYMDLSGPKLRIATIEIKNKKGKIKNQIPVRIGEHIILTKKNTLGKKSKFNKNGEQVKKAEIGVMLPQIIDDVNINDEVLFDDGMIKSVVVSKTNNEVELLITNCYKSTLASHKGINLPDTILTLPALTEQDIINLPFVCRNADIVGYSFVRSQKDVQFLYEQLNQNQAKDIGVVFKIENKEAFENLPSILLEGMKRNKIGVMIARGDLAVEIGFERISEVQNEILWICEAAHVPVIWATQVLENLAKTGIPTRAEISDVVQGVQAECIMLNKGPFINDAIKMLKNILIRMEAHSFKKKNSLRALNIAKNSIHQLIGEINPHPKYKQ